MIGAFSVLPVYSWFHAGTFSHTVGVVLGAPPCCLALKRVPALPTLLTVLLPYRPQLKG